MIEEQTIEDPLERIPDQEIDFIAAVQQGLTELDLGKRITIEEVERELPSWIF